MSAIGQSQRIILGLQGFAQPVGQIFGTQHQTVGVEFLEVLPGVLPGMPDFGWKKLVPEPASQAVGARFDQWRWLSLKCSYKLGFGVRCLGFQRNINRRESFEQIRFSPDPMSSARSFQPEVFSPKRKKGETGYFRSPPFYFASNKDLSGSCSERGTGQGRCPDHLAFQPTSRLCHSRVGLESGCWLCR